MGRPRKQPLVASVVAVYKDGNEEWRWTAYAANNRKVADSGEGYVNKQYARKIAKQLFPGVPVEFR